MASLTQDWETHNKTTLDLDHLKELLPLFSNTDKVNLVKYWTKTPNYWTKTPNYSNDFNRFELDDFRFDFNHLKELLPLVTDQVKSDLVKIWAVSGRDFDFDQFKKIKDLFSDESEKDSLIKFWITRDSSKALDNFVAAAKEDFFGSRYNSENIAKSYFKYRLPDDEIVPLCQKLNPSNELLQSELFACLIQARGRSYFDGLNSSIKSFVTSLSDDDIALQVIQNNRLSISESDILEISSNRLSTKYESIGDILKPKTLEDSLTEVGLEAVKSLFANEDPSLLANKTLADLFSYYDLTNDFITFKSLVKEEVLQEIRETYIPTAKSPYISETEYKKLQNLINSDDHPDTNLTLVPVEVLTKYLKSKISPIPQLVAAAPLLLGEGANGEMIWQESGAQGEMRLLPPPPPSNVAVESISIPPAPQAQSLHEEIAKYHFGKSEILRTLEESKEEDLSNLIESKDSENPAFTELSQITDQFRNLLSKQKDDSSKLEVADFFKKILRLEDSIDSRTGEIVHAIKPDNQAKLYDFFFENRNELAFLFQQENGLDKFSGTIGSLGDGCVANIATQAKVALYQTLIKDNIDQILYSVFVERFSTPILNDGNSDHLGGSRTGTDPLENSHINNHLISPNGLIKVLIEEFYKNEEMVRNPFNFIINFAAENYRNSTDSNLSESDRTLQVEKGMKDLRQILMDRSEEDAASSATSVIVGELSNRLPEEVEIFNTKYLKKFFDHISNIDLDSRQKMENLEMSSQDDRTTLRSSEAAAQKKALFDAKLAESRRRAEVSKQQNENTRMASEDKAPQEAVESASAVSVIPLTHNHDL